MYNPKVMAELVGRCLHMVTQAHVKHLATRSYAKHMALQGLYESVGDLADGLAESCQGKYGLLAINASYEVPGDELALVLGLAQWIEGNSKACCDDDWIQNQIQEIVKLLYGVVYKLRFLA